MKAVNAGRLRRGGTAALAALMAICAAPVLAADAAPPGASSCSGCHAAGSPVPPLAGEPAERTVGAMHGFRSGERPSTVMGRIAKGFSESESAAIAEWLSRQEPEK